MTWYLNDDAENNPIEIGSSLEPQETEKYSISVDNEFTNAVQLTAKCPSELINLMQPDENVLRVELEAYSIGSFEFDIGNERMETFSKSFIVQGINRIESVEITYPDDAELSVDSQIEFTVKTVPEDLLASVEFYIDWRFENGLFGEYTTSTTTTSYAWRTSGDHNIFANLRIPQLDFERIARTRIFLYDPSESFEVEISTICSETFEQIEFTTNPTAIISGQTFIRLTIASDAQTVNQINYTDPDSNQFNFSISTDGTYQASV